MKFQKQIVELLIEKERTLEDIKTILIMLKFYYKDLKNIKQLLSHYEYLDNNPHLKRFLDGTEDKTTAKRSRTSKTKRKNTYK
jgi:hypothetical protein